MRCITISCCFLILFAMLEAHQRFKRNNQYGDELAPPVPAASFPAPSPAEQAPVPIEQAPEAAPPVQPSGYRKKRNNQYGDEVVPPPPAAIPVAAPYQAEESPAPIEQAVPEAAPPVQASGY
ncbi:unnamed protein product [Dracunculus medinensis]|uniref:DUF4794 domain-containing protein n=1 Tax=Dracunculus medinensis TaxID=318479 RepID=A0A0N4UMW3_DRAME|nr:unnamed protein product [Dracunculus medinensis]